MTSYIGQYFPKGKVEWVGWHWFVLSVWLAFVCFFFGGGGSKWPKVGTIASSGCRRNVFFLIVAFANVSWKILYMVVFFLGRLGEWGRLLRVWCPSPLTCLSEDSGVAHGPLQTGYLVWMFLESLHVDMFRVPLLDLLIGVFLSVAYEVLIP